MDLTYISENLIPTYKLHCYISEGSNNYVVVCNRATEVYIPMVVRKI